MKSIKSLILSLTLLASFAGVQTMENAQNNQTISNNPAINEEFVQFMQALASGSITIESMQQFEDYMQQHAAQYPATTANTNNQQNQDQNNQQNQNNQE